MFNDCSLCGEKIYMDGHVITLEDDNTQLIICDDCHKKSRFHIILLCMSCRTAHWRPKRENQEIDAFLYRRFAHCPSCPKE